MPGYTPSEEVVPQVTVHDSDDGQSVDITYTADQAPVVPTEPGEDLDDHHKPSDDKSKDDQHKGNQSEEKHDTDKGCDHQSEQAKAAATAGTAKSTQNKQAINPADKRAQLPQTGTDEKSAAALALIGAGLAVLGLGEAIVKKILY